VVLNNGWIRALVRYVCLYVVLYVVMYVVLWRLYGLMSLCN